MYALALHLVLMPVSVMAFVSDLMHALALYLVMMSVSVILLATD